MIYKAFLHKILNLIYDFYNKHQYKILIHYKSGINILYDIKNILISYFKHFIF